MQAPFWESAQVLLGRAAAPAAATAPGAAATPAPAFPALDPAAPFRGVGLAVAPAYSGVWTAAGLSLKDAGRCRRVSCDARFRLREWTATPPRPQEMSPPRARARSPAPRPAGSSAVAAAAATSCCCCNAAGWTGPGPRRRDAEAPSRSFKLEARGVSRCSAPRRSSANPDPVPNGIQV